MMLAVRDLSIHFATRRGTAKVLDRISLAIAPGEIVGLVGESGSGKSVLSYAISGLLDPAALIVGGDIFWKGAPTATDRAKRKPKAAIAQIFQSPRASLNPIRSVGHQLADVAGASRVTALLDSVSLPAAIAQRYPHEMSGGQCQRVGIALALGCEPDLLIADEPTTGLDVLTEASVLDLIGDLSQRRGMATLLVTHNLALAAARCQRIVVMHAGQIAESAPAETLVAAARHPYAAQLLATVPQHCTGVDDLSVIAGELPDLTGTLPPCRFSRRCAAREDDCDTASPPALVVAPDHLVACRHPLC